MSAPLRTRNLGKTVGRAIELHRLWHQKDAETVEELHYPLESIEVFRAGYLDCITYFSDKWEDDGDCYDYVHECDSKPSVYTQDGGVPVFYVDDGRSMHGPFSLEEMLNNNEAAEELCDELEDMEPGDELQVGGGAAAEYKIHCIPGEQGDPNELLATHVAANATYAMPILAGVKELIVVDDLGKKRSVRFRTLPKLLLCHDKKGLLVLSGELGPIYIRGGKMHVTERGIHR